MFSLRFFSDSPLYENILLPVVDCPESVELYYFPNSGTVNQTVLVIRWLAFRSDYELLVLVFGSHRFH